MADNYNFNKTEYANSVEKIKLNDTQKNFLMTKMQQAESKAVKAVPVIKYRYWTKTIAVVLSLAIIGGVFYFLGGINHNSFIMTANASEISEAEVIIESDYVAGMKVNCLERKALSEYADEEYITDWIEHISISDLSITGENIDTITFKANKALTHFTLFPMGEYAFESQFDENNKPIRDNAFVEAVEKTYEEILPLTNSNFNEKEEETNSLIVQGKRCDSFTYKNPDTTEGKQTISFGSNVTLCLETDRFHDEVQKEYMDIMQECEDSYNATIKEYVELENGMGQYILTDEEIAILQKQQEYRGKLLKRLMDGVSIDVTVKFKNGSQQTKTLELKYKSLEDSVLKMSLAYFVDGGDTNSFSLISSDSVIEDAEIKIASSEMTTGFHMQVFSENGVEPYYNKLGKQDIFNDFLLTDLTIKGEDIESITFEANSKSTYFNLYTDNYENKFIDIQPLTNSQYTQAEFEKYFDGFFGYVCDGFTYLNTNKGNEINLGRLVGLKVESDYTDTEIAILMDTVYECFEKNEAYKRLYAPENKIDGVHYLTEEEIANDKKRSEFMDKVIGKTLDGATMDITVKFTDGSEQRKTLVLGYDNSSDVSFLTAKAS